MTERFLIIFLDLGETEEYDTLTDVSTFIEDKIYQFQERSGSRSSKDSKEFIEENFIIYDTEAKILLYPEIKIKFDVIFNKTR